MPRSSALPIRLPHALPVEIEEADARLDHAVGQLRIEFEDPVHAAEVEHDRPRQTRRGGAIAQVLAACDRPQRRLVLVGQAHDGAHFLHAARRDGRAGRPRQRPASRNRKPAD